MRPKSMVLILFALGCGLVASIGISQVIEKRGRGGGTDVEMESIYVAMVDCPQRTSLTAQMVKLEEWPKERVPMGAIKELEQLEGRTPRHPLYAGEPILETKLIDPQKDLGVVSDKIRPGFRAISVKVDAEVSNANLTLPGDRVDVMVYLQKRPPEIMQTTTTTILRNVTVFAVNDQTSLETDRGETTMAAKTVTLEVRPADAERLMLAQSLGRLRLILRRGDDDEDPEDQSEGVLVNDLFEDRDRSAPNTDPQNPFVQNDGQNAGGGLLQMLNNLNQTRLTAADTSITENVPTKMVTMQIISPDGVEEFTWDEDGSLPRELRQGGMIDEPIAPAASEAPQRPPFPIPGFPPVPGSSSGAPPAVGPEAGAAAEVNTLPPSIGS